MQGDGVLCCWGGVHLSKVLSLEAGTGARTGNQRFDSKRGVAAPHLLNFQYPAINRGDTCVIVMVAYSTHRVRSLFILPVALLQCLVGCVQVTCCNFTSETLSQPRRSQRNRERLRSYSKEQFTLAK